MSTLGSYRNCSTTGIVNFDLQLIHQIQRIAPGVLQRVSHPRIQFKKAAHPYLQAPAAAALIRAVEAAPGTKPLEVESCYRTLGQQFILYNHFLNKRCGIPAAARPGDSNHNGALSIDAREYFWWRPYLERFQWDWLGSFDPPHFDFKGAGIRDMRWLSIKAFQQLYNFNNLKARIVEDGKWGIQTQLALQAVPENGFKNVPGTVDVEQVPRQDLAQYTSVREGMKGDSIWALQRLLKEEGFQLELDGHFGPKTLAAVKAFQKKRELVADGVVGIQTWQALESV
ncbi:peptidoglycan-binding protein [Gloeocapsopsis crepidinum LEGE 06123]|uniref:Peptidoglycan-binding protein n=1 Tax=Gloeocapsopsis crepidinum LEGE 06123 TaxID=588587 RepID=A0ABR9UT04_9CHRO|nr:peptidoglycan-binding protein [Gloeocapsopsis crepidinum]MBE9191431.1 peptidoglycan-binding protein [Gloeocapsopsis crepidinum LEGE 06123]